MKLFHIFAVALMGFSFSANAVDLSGKVGIASDNYFRGMNISDGVGYAATGLVNLDNGIWAGANVMSMEESSDLMTTFGLGYGFELGGIDMDVVYLDRSFQGIDRDGWNEVGFLADFDLFNVSYYKGLDDADDYYEVETSALKFVTVAYGDYDNAGSYIEVSKSWDLAGGSVKVGFIDHDNNDEDLLDKVQDVDNFYVGYSYRF
jgi:hypothetical protein